VAEQMVAASGVQAQSAEQSVASLPPEPAQPSEV